MRGWGAARRVAGMPVVLVVALGLVGTACSEEADAPAPLRSATLPPPLSTTEPRSISELRAALTELSSRLVDAADAAPAAAAGTARACLRLRQLADLEASTSAAVPVERRAELRAAADVCAGDPAAARAMVQALLTALPR